MRCLVLIAALALPVNAYANCPNHTEHSQHQLVKVPAKFKKNRAVREYVSAANSMHQAMDITYTGDADIDFARGMVPHHQGAVDMIAVLKKHGKDEKLMKLANYMSRMQQVEIARMKRWLEVRDNKNLPAAKEGNKAASEYQAAMVVMHKAMDIKYTGKADVDFINGMIPHHQGAIEMAQTLLKYGKDETLRSLARDIIRSQRQEIALMQELVATRN